MTEDGLSDAQVSDILRTARVFAVIGASNKSDRPSYGVMEFLMARGYDFHPVNPGLAGQQILDRTVYGTLADVPAPVDVVDIFRNSEAAGDAVNDAIREKDRLGIKVVWMQLGVINVVAAHSAASQGIIAVMNRCPKIEIGRFGSGPSRL